MRQTKIYNYLPIIIKDEVRNRPPSPPVIIPDEYQPPRWETPPLPQLPFEEMIDNNNTAQPNGGLPPAPQPQAQPQPGIPFTVIGEGNHLEMVVFLLSDD